LNTKEIWSKWSLCMDSFSTWWILHGHSAVDCGQDFTHYRCVLFKPYPHCFKAITKPTAQGWKERLQYYTPPSSQNCGRSRGGGGVLSLPICSPEDLLTVIKRLITLILSLIFKKYFAKASRTYFRHKKELLIHK
jgi:hypothetical protein